MAVARVFDADTHYYEPEDCFTRYIDPKHRDLAIEWKEVDGERRFCIGDRLYTFVEDPTFSFVERPGSLAEMLHKGDYAAKAGSEREPPPAQFIEDRGARLRTMDQQGIDQALMFPTLGVTVEHFMRHDPVQTFANLRAFNRWLEEVWGYDRDGRIYSVALMSLLDLDMAVEELDRVLKAGARMIHLRPGPQGGRSPADPVFDPFWARLNEAKVPVAFHISESSYNEMFSVAWGEEANPSSHRQSAFQWTNFFGDRPVMDTISSIIYMNLFGRYPNLKCLSVENGSLWVPYLLKAMDKMKGMGRQGPWKGGYVPGRPSEIFKRHVFVCPYAEEPVEPLVEMIGEGKVVFGSDFPHAEGLAEPRDYERKLAPFAAPVQEKIMRGNALDLLGLAA